MKKTINFYDFERAFADYGRSKQFTYSGQKALHDYLEAYEDDLGEELELDVVALCCEYTEYESLEEFQANYGADEYPDMKSIEDKTQVICIDDDSFIIFDF